MIGCLAYVDVTPELLVAWLKGGGPGRPSNLPRDARVRGFDCDQSANCIRVYVESESFHLVREGQSIPPYELRLVEEEVV